MSGRVFLSPWAGGAVLGAGLTREAIEERIPDGWTFHGEVPHPHGRRRGPYRFTLTHYWTEATRSVTASCVADVPRALDELFAEVAA